MDFHVKFDKKIDARAFELLKPLRDIIRIEDFPEYAKIFTGSKHAADELLKLRNELRRPQSEWSSEWCECGSVVGYKSQYVGDRMCRCGVDKHHYHCLDCKKIVQIG